MSGLVLIFFLHKKARFGVNGGHRRAVMPPARLASRQALINTDKKSGFYLYSAVRICGRFFFSYTVIRVPSNRVNV
jgi:hypothetical protein